MLHNYLPKALIIDYISSHVMHCGVSKFILVFFFHYSVQFNNTNKFSITVLSVCKTWSSTLRKEWRPRVFENKILRRIFVPKRDENGDWGRFHNQGLHSVYRAPNIVRVIKSIRLRWAGHVSRIEVFIFFRRFQFMILNQGSVLHLRKLWYLYFTVFSIHEFKSVVCVPC